MPGEGSVTYKSLLVNAFFCVGAELCLHSCRCFVPSQGKWLTTVTSVLYATFSPQQSLFMSKLQPRRRGNPRLGNECTRAEVSKLTTYDMAGQGKVGVRKENKILTGRLEIKHHSMFPF